jgi:hypothetical protein
MSITIFVTFSVIVAASLMRRHARRSREEQYLSPSGLRSLHARIATVMIVEHPAPASGTEDIALHVARSSSHLAPTLRLPAGRHVTTSRERCSSRHSLRLIKKPLNFKQLTLEP